MSTDMATLGLSPLSPSPHRPLDFNYRLSVGAVLGRTFSAWAGNLVPFTVLSFVLMLPVLMSNVLVLALRPQGGLQTALSVGAFVLRFVFGFILSGALTYGVFQEVRGQRASLGDNIRAGLSSAGRVFLASVLMSLMIGAGFCALIVPGIYAMVALAAVIPVAVVEAPGASASISRSFELTAGNRWSVFGVTLVTGFIVTGAAVAISKLLAAAGLGVAGDDAYGNLRSEMLSTLAILPLSPLTAIGQVMIYHDLRVGREGADVEELVKVFE